MTPSALLVRRVLWVLLLVPGVQAGLQAQRIANEGLPRVTNFSPAETGGQQQNWAIAQAPSGLIFVANNKGLLEYDGNSWQLHSLPGDRAVRAVAADSAGRVYVGAEGEIGYFEPDEQGRLEYTSLTPDLLAALPDSSRATRRELTTFWSVANFSDGLYFVSENLLARWNSDGFLLRFPEPGDLFLDAFAVRDMLYVQESGAGILYMLGDYLQSVSHADRFVGTTVDFILPDGEDNLLIGSRRYGLESHDHTRYRKLPSEVSRILKQSPASSALRLNDSTYAMGLLGGGVVIHNDQGDIRRRFDRKAGLRDELVLNLAQDREGGLWLALDNGLSRMNYPAPITYFADAYNINGEVHALVRNDAGLYAGTYKGVFFLENAKDRQPELRRVAGIIAECRALKAVGNGLLALTQAGLYHIRGQRSRLIAKQQGDALFWSRDRPGYAYIGTPNGLFELRRQGNTWGRPRLFKNFQSEVSGITEDVANNLWFAAPGKGVYMINFQEENPRVNRFDTSQGLPQLKNLSVVRLGGKLCVATPQGIYQFNSASEQFGLDTRFRIEGSGADTISVRLAAQSPNGRVFLEEAQPGNRVYTAQPSDAFDDYKLQLTPFAETSHLGHLQSFYVDDNNTLWAGLSEGFVRFDASLWEPKPFRYAALVRAVRAANDSLLPINTYLPENNRLLTIPYKIATNLSFECVGLSMQDPGTLQYQYYLEGLDESWSHWTSDQFRRFSALGTGRYTLRVRARNTAGVVSRVGRLSFEILPPWYGTAWAYAAYILLGGLLVYGIVRWRIHRVKRERDRLEESVTARTEEVTLQKAILEQAYDEINRQNADLENQSEELKRTVEELQAAQSQLVMSEKMAVLGQLVAGVAHEINTPIGVVNASASNMKEEFPLIVERWPSLYASLDEPTREAFWQFIQAALSAENTLLSTREQRKLRREIKAELENAGLAGDLSSLARELAKMQFQEDLTPYLPVFRSERRGELVEMASVIARVQFHLATILDSVRKTEKIIKSLKSYSYRHSPDIPEETDLVRNVDTVLTINENSLKQFELNFQAEENLPPIQAFPDELSQVWTNLIHNATYVLSPEEGKIQVRVYSCGEEKQAVEVEDNGPGIPEDIQANIFDAFYTTKPKGQGTGLGLDICQKIVKKHQGEIQLESEPGRTLFRVVLPENLDLSSETANKAPDEKAAAATAEAQSEAQQASSSTPADTQSGSSSSSS